MWKSYDALFSVLNVWTLYIFSFIFLRSNTILETNLYTLSTRSISPFYPIINLSITNELLMVQVTSIFRAEKYYKLSNKFHWRMTIICQISTGKYDLWSVKGLISRRDFWHVIRRNEQRENYSIAQQFVSG